MNFTDYQKLAQRTSPAGHDKILNGVMGLAGESGECVDIVKKAMFQGHELDKDKLLEELGDCMWYCAELASGLGVSLETVAMNNYKKLLKRYPEGFDAERSIHREE